jgi:hypothetical protein
MVLRDYEVRRMSNLILPLPNAHKRHTFNSPTTTVITYYRIIHMDLQSPAWHP